MKPYYDHAGITIYHGDCREILPSLTIADHIITDPPYDEHTHSKQRRGSANGKGHQFGFGRSGSSGISMERHVGFGFICQDDMNLVAAEIARLTRRWILIFCAMEQQAGWMSALTQNDLEHVRFGVWHKLGSTPQFTGDRPGTATEAIEIAHPPGRKRWNGGGGFGFWTAPIVKTQTGERCHPTQKPDDLISALVGDFTDLGEKILDPFMGSGTTLRAAKDLGRRAIGIEIEERYCEIAAKRMAQEVLPLKA